MWPFRTRKITQDRGRAVVIGCEKHISRLLQSLLQRQGQSVCVVETLSEAIDVVREGGPFCIFANDSNLAESRAEILERLREANPDVQVGWIDFNHRRFDFPDGPFGPTGFAPVVPR